MGHGAPWRPPLPLGSGEVLEFRAVCSGITESREQLRGDLGQHQPEPNGGVLVALGGHAGVPGQRADGAALHVRVTSFQNISPPGSEMIFDKVLEVLHIFQRLSGLRKENNHSKIGHLNVLKVNILPWEVFGGDRASISGSAGRCSRCRGRSSSPPRQSQPASRSRLR